MDNPLKKLKGAGEKVAKVYKDITLIDELGEATGIIESDAQKKKKAQAAAEAEKAKAAYEGLESPGTQYTDLTSAYGGIKSNPLYTNAMNQSLGSYDDVIKGGGMTAADRANLKKSLTANSTADRGRREAIQANAQASGMASGGNQLLAQLNSSQAATNQGNQNALDTAGMAQARALQAIQAKGQLGAQFDNQSFGQQATKAGAADSISQFNSNQRIAVPQQDFANKLAIAQGKSGASTQLGNFYGGQANQEDVRKSQLLGGLIQGGSAAYGGGMGSDKDLKHSIKPMDDKEIEEFLSAVKPSQYKYKDPSTPITAPGQRDGLIAQDVKDTALGKDVVKADENGTLVIDRDNLSGIMLAALAKMQKEKK